MKKLITMIGAAAAAFGLYADTPADALVSSAISAEVDEFYDEGTSVLEQDGWYMAESAADAAVVKAYGEETAPNHTALYAASPDAVQTQAQYIGLDSEAPVYRTFAPINDLGTMGEVAIETTERGGIIADQLVKFSAFEDDPADLGDAKIAVWVKTVQEENGETPAVNHLMISTAALNSDDFSPTLTNIDTEVRVDVANWYQLKITAIQAATADGEPIPGFVVELNGTEIEMADGLFPVIAPVTYTAQGAALIVAKKLFPSRIAVGLGGADTLQGVAFKGTGAIDDITVAAAPVYIDPSPAPTYVAEIGDTGYATIEAAIEAVQAGQTIKLLADLTTTVIVPAGKDFTLNFNGFGLTTNWGIQNCGTLTIVNGKINTIESSVVLYGGSVTTIESGTFTATDNAVISGQGNAQNNNVTLTINGGTFTGGITTPGYIACGVYVANSGTYAIKGGTFNITNGCGICARAGQVTVAKEATFNVSGSITGKVGDKNVAIPCVAMYIDYSEPPYPGYDEKDFLKAEVNTLSIADGFEWAGPVDGLYTLQAKSTTVEIKPGETATGIVAATAAEALSKVTITPVNAAAEAAGQAAVIMGQATQGADGKWTVVPVINEMAPAFKAPDVALPATLAAIVADTDSEVTVALPAADVTPGLYYSIDVATDLGAAFEEGDRVLATSAGVTLSVEKPDGGKAFFKVSEHMAPAAANQD